MAASDHSRLDSSWGGGGGAAGRWRAPGCEHPAGCRPGPGARPAARPCTAAGSAPRPCLPAPAGPQLQALPPRARPARLTCGLNCGSSGSASRTSSRISSCGTRPRCAYALARLEMVCGGRGEGGEGGEGLGMVEDGGGRRWRAGWRWSAEGCDGQKGGQASGTHRGGVRLRSPPGAACTAGGHGAPPRSPPVHRTRARACGLTRERQERSPSSSSSSSGMRSSRACQGWAGRQAGGCTVREKGRGGRSSAACARSRREGGGKSGQVGTTAITGLPGRAAARRSTGRAQAEGAAERRGSQSPASPLVARRRLA